MELYYRRFGSGPPIIILHGLYGSSDNWISIAKQFKSTYDVIIPDLRNHGNSPHSPYHNYELMQSDIYKLMTKLNLQKATIIGHSMGGKTAMYFAKNHPMMLSNLIILDISPLSYKLESSHKHQVLLHQKIINALSSIDPEKIEKREEADKILEKFIDQPSLRYFLLKNLKRDFRNKFTWKLNLTTIKKSLNDLLEGLDPYNSIFPITGFPVLFINGERSTYLKRKDIPAIQTIFPAADFNTISMAGHWLHAEQPNTLINLIKNFLE